jgi:hypothetical protein
MIRTVPGPTPPGGQPSPPAVDARAVRLKRALEAQKEQEASALRKLEPKGRVVDLRA